MMRIEEDYFTQMAHPIDWLRVEYARRRERNPQYSLRAFARSLRVRSGPLSEILNKKRRLTVKLGARLAERLGLSPRDAERFLALIRATNGTGATRPQATLAEAQEFQQLSSDTFYLISDWYHYSLMSLTETENFENDPKWIAGRLGISVTEVRVAIDRLLRLGLLRQENGRLLTAGSFSFLPRPLPSAALRKYHRQVLEKAIRAIEEVPLEVRDITSITMAIDVGKIHEASDAIARFRREMAGLLENGKRTEVYHLNIQLIPINQGGET
jgi:uncharacterized protein (TIGR02147 family)